MAYKGTINLMALKGAKCITVKTEDGKIQQGVFIPAAYNDMLRAKDGKYEISPYINIRAWEASQNFINAYLSRRSGEANVVTPSHTINVSFSQEFEQRAIEAASKRITAERVSAGLPALTPDELQKAAKYAASIMIGTLSPIERKQPTYQANETVQAEVFNGASQANDASAFEAPIDDLPF